MGTRNLMRTRRSLFRGAGEDRARGGRSPSPVGARLRSALPPGRQNRTVSTGRAHANSYRKTSCYLRSGPGPSYQHRVCGDGHPWAVISFVSERPYTALKSNGRHPPPFRIGRPSRRRIDGPVGRRNRVPRARARSTGFRNGETAAGA